MADDWQPGDLALCVNDAPIRHANGCMSLGGTLLAKGKTYRVGAVKINPITRVLNLRLREVSSPSATGGFAAARFIKVTPEEADEFDRETIALLTGKPAQVPA